MAFNSNDDDREQKTVVGFLIGAVVLLAIALAIGFGMSRAGVFGKKHGAANKAGAHATLAGSGTGVGAAAAGALASAGGANGQHGEKGKAGDQGQHGNGGNSGAHGAAGAAGQAASGQAAGGSAGTATAGAAAGTGAADEASVKVVDGVVRFYFASGKSAIASGAKEALADVVAAAKAGKKLVISGYHDSTGDPAKNAELAKQRAIAVRDALKTHGVAESSIDMKKPEIMPDTKGSDPEARRVDVKIGS